MNKCHLYVEDVLITGGEYKKKAPEINRGLENIIVVEGYGFSITSIK